MVQIVNGMFVSFGESGGLPKFFKISQIYLVNGLLAQLPPRSSKYIGNFR